jgi:hypothetical protein
MEAVKYVSLGKRRHYFLSLGGQSRQLYEYFRNADWLPVGHDGYYLHCNYLHGDLHLGRHTRIFGEAGSGWERGRREGPTLGSVKGGEARVVHFILDSEDRGNIFASRRKGATGL